MVGTHDSLIEPFVLALIKEHFESLEGKIILDTGCGLGGWGFLLRTSTKTNLELKGEKALLIGIDIFEPNLKKLKKIQIYDYLIKADVRYLPFKDKTFNFVIASEILEHLPKKAGLGVLLKLESITKDMILITTPYGFYYQKGFDNPYEEHISTWNGDEFIELNYQTLYIIAGSKSVSKISKTLTYLGASNKILLKALAYLLAPFFIFSQALVKVKPKYIITYKILNRIEQNEN